MYSLYGIMKRSKCLNWQVDALTQGSYKELKILFPDVKIVQVIHVIDETSVEEAIEISEQVDALLLDSRAK